jgi:hypothetical protein
MKYKILSVLVISAMIITGFACIADREAEASGITIPTFNPLVELGYLWGLLNGASLAQSASMGADSANYAGNIYNNTLNALSMGQAEIKNSGNFYNYSKFVFERYTESSAWALYDKQKLNNEAYVYDSGYVLGHSPVVYSLLSTLVHCDGIYNTVFYPFRSYGATFIGNVQNTNWQVTYGVNALTSTATSNTNMALDFGSFIKPTGNDYVFLSNATTFTVIPTVAEVVDHSFYILDKNDNIVFSGSPTGVGTIHKYKFTGESGLYKVHMGDSIMYADYVANNYVGTNYVFHGMYVEDFSTNHMLEYFYVPVSNVLMWYGYGDASMATPIEVNNNDVYIILNPETYETHKISVYDMLRVLNLLDGYFNSLVTTCNSFGVTAYNAQVASNGNAPRIAPDAMQLDPNQLSDLTPEQIYAIYISYINALKDAMENYTKLDPGLINISGASLDLICRGTIYDNTGHALGDNTTVFTPYISVSNYKLKIGNNIINQTGFYLVYGNSTNITNFDTDKQTVQYNSYKYGTNFNILEMMYKGEKVVTKWINTTQIVYLYGNNNGTITPPPSTGTFTNNKYMLYEIADGAILLVGVTTWVIGMNIKGRKSKDIKTIGKTLIILSIFVAIGIICWMAIDFLTPGFSWLVGLWK